MTITVIHNWNRSKARHFDDVIKYGFLEGGYLDVVTMHKKVKTHHIIKLDSIEKIELRD